MDELTGLRVKGDNVKLTLVPASWTLANLDVSAHKEPSQLVPFRHQVLQVIARQVRTSCWSSDSGVHLQDRFLQPDTIRSLLYVHALCACAGARWRCACGREQLAGLCITTRDDLPIRNKVGPPKVHDDEARCNAESATPCAGLEA
jgi:hypothetical protein